MKFRNRKKHKCGHRGYGRYCHRCRQAAELDKRAEEPGLGETVVKRLQADAERLRAL